MANPNPNKEQVPRCSDGWHRGLLYREVALPLDGTIKQATDASCAAAGDGWRLPSADDLSELLGRSQEAGPGYCGPGYEWSDNQASIEGKTVIYTVLPGHHNRWVSMRYTKINTYRVQAPNGRWTDKLQDARASDIDWDGKELPADRIGTRPKTIILVKPGDRPTLAALGDENEFVDAREDAE